MVHTEEYTRQYMKTWREANPRKVKANRERDKTKRRTDPVYRLLNNAYKTVSRSKIDNVECSRTALELVASDPPKMCPCCKVSIDYSGDQGNKPLGRGHSFDRVDNKRGYVEGNVQIICRRCNTLKGNMGVQDLLNIVDYIREYSG